MLKVRVTYHKDGDHLEIVQVPWWYDIYNRSIDRICPCCGLTGLITGKFDWLNGKLYEIWNNLIGYSFKYEKDLFKVSIESGCIASKAIWNEHNFCWIDDCPLNEEEEEIVS